MPLDDNRRRWQFSLRQLLVVMAVVAFILTATVALPTVYGSISLLMATLILPGVLGTIAAVGDRQTKTFCLTAAIPIVFCLYAVGWAIGWVVFQSFSSSDILMWFHNNGEALKTVILSAWLCAAVVGLICVVIYRMIEQRS